MLFSWSVVLFRQLYRLKTVFKITGKDYCYHMSLCFTNVVVQLYKNNLYWSYMTIGNELQSTISSSSPKIMIYNNQNIMNPMIFRHGTLCSAGFRVWWSFTFNTTSSWVVYLLCMPQCHELPTENVNKNHALIQHYIAGYR